MAKIAVAVKDASGGSHNMLYEDGNATGKQQCVEVVSISASVTPGVAATNLGKAEDAVAASGDTGIAVWAVRRDTPTSNVNAAGDYAEIGVSGNGAVWTTVVPTAAQVGCTVSRVISAATTNATSVKASAGQVYGWVLCNNAASAKFVKLYNKASAPTVGTDIPVMTIAVPANQTVLIELKNGIKFATGIALAITGAYADADTTATAAGDVVAHLLYV